MMKAKGRCYCGALEFEVDGDALMKAQCHCRECQYITGGGPNYFVMVPNDAYRYTRGTPQSFERTDLETPRRREFCGICGTHMTTRLPTRPLTVVKVGTMNTPEQSYGAPDMVIFAKDAQAFHEFPEGVPVYETLPPRR